MISIGLNTDGMLIFRSAEHQRALWKLQEVSSTTETQGMSMFYVGCSTQLAFGEEQ